MGWMDGMKVPAGDSDAFGEVLQLIGQPALLDDATLRHRHFAQAVIGWRVRDLELLQRQHHHLPRRRLLIIQINANH